MTNCIICNSEAKIDETNPHEFKITCKFCGKFSITDVALNVIPKNVNKNWSKKIQDWIKMNHTDGHVLITTSVIKSIF